MADKFLCAMALYDAATESRLAEMQNRVYEKGFVGRQTKRLPQHITLGIFPTEKEDELSRLVERVGRETEPFDVSLSHIGLFGGSKVLFVAPDSNHRLLALRERFGDSLGWTPHSTMLIDDPPVIWNALPALAEAFQPFQGRVEAVRLYEFAPTRMILTAPLEGQGESL